jgi:glycerol-1-phosphate dehydrogenase [NAD(P)+]
MYYFSEFLSAGLIKNPPDIILSDGAVRLLVKQLTTESRRSLILWDPDTCGAVSAWLDVAELEKAGHGFLLLEQSPLPTLEAAEKVTRRLQEGGFALIVAVGSGVISDIAKKAASPAGVASWCLMTAASVDAFTSPTSAIRIGGYHESMPITPSERIFADTTILINAPLRLSLSGLGDLVAKFIAAADWHMSSLITGESFDSRSAQYSVDSARFALDQITGVLEGKEEPFRALSDAVLTSGLIMRATGSTRPASSSEHTLAHYWEMAGIIGNREWDLHGILVAAASRIICRVYRQLLDLWDQNPTISADTAAASVENDFELNDPRFTTRIRQKIESEAAGARLLPSRHLRRQALLAHRDDLYKIYRPLLAAAETALDSLANAGLPLTLAELGIPSEEACFGLEHISLLRNRYSLINCLRDIGFHDEVKSCLKECCQPYSVENL